LYNHEAQLENLQNQKKALMQQLLTGKRRVKVDNREPGGGI
jgi:restriction endonuclease S subunit